MPLTPPFTTAEFLAAVAPTFAMPVNAVQQRTKPRASGLGACARQQAYMMSGTLHDAIGSEGSRRATDGDLTAEQGRMFEDLSVKIISNMGFAVVDRQVELPEDYPVSGHPDGRLSGNTDGLIWGWEHKHLGRWAYETVLKKGLMKGEPGYILQSALYGHALGWDAALFTIISQDSSSVRGDMTANLRAKNPEVRWATDPNIHPKVHIATVDMAPLFHGLIPIALDRARWLTRWAEQDNNPANVAREYDPEVRESKWVADGEGGRMEVDSAPFPCGWCPYMSKCLSDGSGGKEAPRLPWTESVGADAD